MNEAEIAERKAKVACIHCGGVSVTFPEGNHPEEVKRYLDAKHTYELNENELCSCAEGNRPENLGISRLVSDARVSA